MSRTFIVRDLAATAGNMVGRPLLHRVAIFVAGRVSAIGFAD